MNRRVIAPVLERAVENTVQEPAPYRPNRAERRKAAPAKSRPVFGGRACLGPKICTKETYDGTPFLAAALGQVEVGPHHVRNAMRRVRQGRPA